VRVLPKNLPAKTSQVDHSPGGANCDGRAHQSRHA